MWSVLVSWVTVAIVVPVVIGIGVGVLSMNPPHYSIAQVCFTLSAVILLARVGWSIAIEQRLHTAAFQRGLFAFVIFGVIGVLWAQSVAWVAGLRTPEGKNQGSLDRIQADATSLINRYLGTISKAYRDKEYWMDPNRKISPQSIQWHIGQANKDFYDIYRKQYEREVTKVQSGLMGQIKTPPAVPLGFPDRDKIYFFREGDTVTPEDGEQQLLDLCTLLGADAERE